MKTHFSPRLFIATSAIALGLATSAMAMPFGGNGPDGGKSGHHTCKPAKSSGELAMKL